MGQYDSIRQQLLVKPKTWLVTGVSGFIGSHLLETLLSLNQVVVGLDNFSNGKRQNLDEVQAKMKPEQWARFRLIEGDVADPKICNGSVEKVELVLHQAAQGSVPRSIESPGVFHESNVTGTFNLLLSCQKAGIRRFVYASSSSVYGDEPTLPKIEDRLGVPLSPYAATKAICETYAATFAKAYDLEAVGLRYFNVFGPRQDPNGAYAAVIPKWITALLRREQIHINGDGETSRDFCYVDNVVQANLLAACTTNAAALNQCYNVALGERTTLNQLFDCLQTALKPKRPELPVQKANYREFRQGDIQHSLADISKARNLLGFSPECPIAEGLELAMDWYCKHLG